MNSGFLSWSNGRNWQPRWARQGARWSLNNIRRKTITLP